MSPQLKHMRLTHSLVPLSEAKGLKYRFFAVLLRNKIFALYSSFVAARHSGRATRDPESRKKNWIPACAGMTAREKPTVSASAHSAVRYGQLRMTSLRGFILKYTNIIWSDLVSGFSPPAFCSPAPRLSDPRRWTLDSSLSAYRPLSHVSRFTPYASRLTFL
jgi:hypothetical protein